MLPDLIIPKEAALNDDAQWRFRFTIESETSNRLYVIAQHKTKGHWGCSCMGWKRYRHCKHLDSLNLPGYEKPHNVNIIST